MFDSVVVGLVIGLVQGSLYGLFACGLVFVYCGTRVVNVAQGEFGMVGGFLVYELYVLQDVSLAGSLAAGFVIAIVLAVATESLIVRRVKGMTLGMSLVVTLALVTLLQAGTRQVFPYSTDLSNFPLVLGGSWQLGPVFLSGQQLAAIATAGTLFGVLTATWEKSQFGRVLRTVAQNGSLAEVVGIRVGRVRLMTWGIGGGLSFITAILFAPLTTFHVLFMFNLLSRALVAAMVGGMTSLRGAFVAGIGIGVLESGIRLSTGIPGATAVVLFVGLLGFLFLKPRGLLGSEY